MKINIIDKFLYKLLFLTFILVLLVVLDNKLIINIETLKQEISSNINIIDIIKYINGDLNIIDLGDNEIDVFLNNIKTEEISKNKYLVKTKTNKIYSTSIGNVIKINKNNDLYSVSILDENNNILIYDGLDEINVKMYQIIKVNDLIGYGTKSNNNDSYLYHYKLIINEN